MKIKLAILDSDQNYLNRISGVFTTKYANKVEFYSFTDLAVAYRNLENAKIDVFIAGSDFDVDASILPKRCVFMYFLDSVGIESYKNQKAICKFQKIDVIYKEVLNIYSDSVDVAFEKSSIEGNARIVMFTSAGGGVGTSTLAATFAMTVASNKYKSLYVNLEPTGSASTYFSCQGQHDFSSVIYAVKGKRPNIGTRLESTVKQDSSGVYFYDSCKLALDLDEMTIDDFNVLLTELGSAGYDYIVLDAPFSYDERYVELLKTSHRIVFVSDGSITANTKFIRAYVALEALENRDDISICNRIGIMYNKFSKKTCTHIENGNIDVIGGVPKIEQVTIQQLLNKIQEMQVFAMLV